jgi:hypothetical protein
VQVMHRSEPSAPRDPADTKEIVPHEAGGDRTASRKIVQVTDHGRTAPDASRPNPVAASSPGPPRPWVKRAASLAMFAGVLLLVAWLAFPPLPAEPEDDGPGSSREAYRVPEKPDGGSR